MLKSVVLIGLFLVSITNCFTYPTYQSGTGVGIFPNTKHIFLTSNKIGRTIDIEVKFQKEFDQIPRIGVANSVIDMELGAMGYNTDVIKASSQGFTIRATAQTDKVINELVYNWFATTDPSVHVQYIHTRDLGSLALKSEGDIEREHVLSIPIINWEHKSEDTLVQAFLIGTSFKSGKTLGVRQSVVSVKDDELKLKFSVDAKSDVIVEFVKLCLIMSDSAMVYQSQDMGARVNDDNVWLQRQDGVGTDMEVEFEIPSMLEEGKRTYIGGITGFEAPVENSGIRIEIGGLTQQNDQVSMSFGTWENSQLRELGVQVLFFGQSGVKIFDEHCAEVFSECGYEGESFKICGSQNELTGFSGPIKSIHLPKDGYITLFDQEGLQGERLTIEESKECLEMNVKL